MRASGFMNYDILTKQKIDITKNITTVLSIASTQTNNYLIWFQDEDKYSIVEKKQIVEKHPKVQETVSVKGATGRWTGRVVFAGMFRCNINFKNLQKCKQSSVEPQSNFSQEQTINAKHGLESTKLCSMTVYLQTQ